METGIPMTTTQKRPARTANGIPVIDPTENVKALSEALSTRQDDLRDANNKYMESRLESVTVLAEIRSAHAREIRHLEADRLEKIRQVDVSNTAITAGQQLAAIQTLAATAAANADALRAAVASTAAAIQNQTDRIVAGMVERIAVLEKSSYTGAGRAGLADPAIERLSAMVEALTRAQNTSVGKREGISSSVGILLAVLSALGVLAGIGGVIYGAMK